MCRCLAIAITPSLASKTRARALLVSESIDITKINVKKEVAQCNNCLEIFIILLSRHLQLNPKQVRNAISTHCCARAPHTEAITKAQSFTNPLA